MSLSQTQLDEIADEFTRQIRRGEHVSVDEYVEKYLGNQPNDELRGLLNSIAMIEGIKASSNSGLAPNDSLQKLEQLDDYTIVREIGRGGMGVVFEGIHQSLGRRVAIKVLAADILNQQKHLARFRTEARAVARLRHAHIVPIFGVGHASDHHYYVMDYIEGESLREYLNRLSGHRGKSLPTCDIAVGGSNTALSGSGLTQPSLDGAPDVDESQSPPFDAPPPDTPAYFRWVAHLGCTISDALAYAHDRGVLHRDIKPANLLIDRRGEAWIADFGLAKLAEHPSVTQTGDVVGTPQYMPPESFDGRYDQQSEVYAVGLTLYELLAMRPAIEGKSTADTIRKATAGVTTPPRQYNSRIPGDLEKVVLKALRPTPEDRYATAADLREDLDRFLAGRPVSARRVGPVERGLRWVKREPMLAALTAASFLLLAALTIVSCIAYFRTKGALNAAEVAQQETEQALEMKDSALVTADQQRERAESNLQTALDALSQIMDHVSPRGVEVDAEVLGEETDTTASHVTPRDAELLQSLLTFFDQLAQNNDGNYLLAEAAVAAQRAGDIYVILGELRKADRAYTESVARYQSLAKSAPDELEFVNAQAAVLNELVVISSIRGQLLRANDLFQRTRDLMDESPAALELAEGKFEYARAHRLVASLGYRSGLSNLKDISSLPRQRRPFHPNMRKRNERDLDAVEKCIDLLNELVEEALSESDMPTGNALLPTVIYQAELARAFRVQAEVLSRGRFSGRSQEALDESIRIFEDLLKSNPESQALKYELAMTLVSAQAFGANDQKRAGRADELSQQLLDDAPDLPRYRALQAQCLVGFATLNEENNRLQKADQEFTRSIRIYSQLLSQSPELRLYETRLVESLQSLAHVKQRQGKTDAAIEILERALRRMEPRFARRLGVSAATRLQIELVRKQLNDLKSAASPG